MNYSAFLSPSNLRADGRRAHEVRRVRARAGVSPRADGSALVDAGGTRVLALVHGPRRGAAARAGGGGGGGGGGDDGATVTVDFLVAPFAGAERRVRRAGDRALADAAAAARGVFEGVVLRALYPRADIAVTLLVLRNDGGALAAAVNAGVLALADAGVALRDAACAAGALAAGGGGGGGGGGALFLLDPSAAELALGAPELVLALLPASGDALLASVDARLPAAALGPLLEAAADAARQAYAVIAAALREVTERRVRERAGGARSAVAGGGAGGGGAGDAEIELAIADALRAAPGAGDASDEGGMGE
jgi:exosome complex component RRP41